MKKKMFFVLALSLLGATVFAGDGEKAKVKRKKQAAEQTLTDTQSAIAERLRKAIPLPLTELEKVQKYVDAHPDADFYKLAELYNTTESGSAAEDFIALKLEKKADTDIELKKVLLGMFSPEYAKRKAQNRLGIAFNYER